MVSMKDIAAACGVSVATVSKSLNNHSDIGEETKAMVKRMAKEMGYHPNFSARALKTNKSYNLGVLYKDDAGSGLTHDYFAQVLENFKVTAENKGYDITFLNNSKLRKDKMSYLEHSIYRGMDGVMIAVVDFENPEEDFSEKNESSIFNVTEEESEVDEIEESVIMEAPIVPSMDDNPFA